MAYSRFLFLLLFFGGVVMIPLELQAQQGVIEVYVDQHRGNPTASGELYNPAALTAAHDHLPIGTFLRITNTLTGQAVDVRVNDRKPRDERVVYISGAAGQRLSLAPGQATEGHVQVLSSAPNRGRGAAKPQGWSGWFQKKNSVEGGEAISQAGAAPAPVAAQTNTGGKGFFGRVFGNGNASRQGAMPRGASSYEYQQPAYAPNGQVIPMSAPYPRPGNVPAPGPYTQDARASTAIPPAGASSSLPVSSAAPYRVQFGAFKKAKHAEDLNSTLLRGGVSTTIVQSTANQLFLVVTSQGFASAGNAQRWVDFEGSRRGWQERPVVIR